MIRSQDVRRGRGDLLLTFLVNIFHFSFFDFTLSYLYGLHLLLLHSEECTGFSICLGRLLARFGIWNAVLGARGWLLLVGIVHHVFGTDLSLDLGRFFGRGLVINRNWLLFWLRLGWWIEWLPRLGHNLLGRCLDCFVLLWIPIVR